jgi:hypothetical protein
MGRFPSADKHFVAKQVYILTCCLRRELKWVLGLQKSETSARNACVPNLWYYDLLSFIAKSEIPRQGKSNIDSHKETDDENTKSYT